MGYVIRNSYIILSWSNRIFLSFWHWYAISANGDIYHE